MSKFIFRRVKGRLVPIKISSEKAGEGLRRIKAVARMDGEDVRAATMFVKSSKVRKSVNIESVGVVDDFRKQGIAKELFEHAQKLYGRAGKKFIRSPFITHEAQTKIRAKAGKSKFIARGFVAANKPRLVTAEQASAVVENTRKGFMDSMPSFISSSTMIPKKFRKGFKK